MSTLLLNGCSFAECWSPNENFLRTLKCDRVENLGLRAGSFQRVARTTVEWVAKYGNPEFVIIPIPLVSRWELSVAKQENGLDGTWYPMQHSLIEQQFISDLVSADKLKSLLELYYGCVPDIRTFWDLCFTNIILLASFLENKKINYLMFNMCNQFNKEDLKDFNGVKYYKGFDKIKLIEENKKIIDVFKFCGNNFMWDAMNITHKDDIDKLMHHHGAREYECLENYLSNYLKLQFK